MYNFRRWKEDQRRNISFFVLIEDEWITAAFFKDCVCSTCQSHRQKKQLQIEAPIVFVEFLAIFWAGSFGEKICSIFFHWCSLLVINFKRLSSRLQLFHQFWGRPQIGIPIAGRQLWPKCLFDNSTLMHDPWFRSSYLVYFYVSPIILRQPWNQPV